LKLYPIKKILKEEWLNPKLMSEFAKLLVDKNYDYRIDEKIKITNNYIHKNIQTSSNFIFKKFFENC